MNKKIKTTHLSLNKFTGRMIYITIDTFRFLYDEDTFYLTVEVENQGQFEFLEEIDLPEGEIITDYKDLERFALNWIFDNVEIVKEEVKKETLTVKEAIAVLDECKHQVLNEMPINKNLNSKITW